MYGFVYITINLTNNKRYLGVKSYKRNWERYLGSGKLLKRAISKVGSKNFKRVIICEAETKKELSQLEKYFITKLRCVEDDTWYNLVSGGLGNSNGFKGKKHTKERNRKLSDKMMGHTVSDKTRAAVSKTGKIKIQMILALPPIECPHCNKIGMQGPMRRWHFDNCKSLQVAN